MKKNDLGDTLAFVMLSGYAIFTFMRGLFWFVGNDKIVSDSEFYEALHQVLPMWVWGGLLMIVAVILFIAAWFIPMEKYNNVCHWLLIIGGLGTCIMYFLLTSASMFNAINWLTWSQFAILTAKSGAIALIGGMMMNDRRQ